MAAAGGSGEADPKVSSAPYPLAASLIADQSFPALAGQWAKDPAPQMLGFVWKAYDEMLTKLPYVDGRDLERSITQLLEPRIREAMTGDEPYYIQHGAFERETMAPPPAQPPQYDLAFVLHADERIMWPLEAKVLETPGTLAEYGREVREQFLTCRYAPFTTSGAMLGYLLTGSAADALIKIGAKLNTTLDQVADFPQRPHRESMHKRNAPPGKQYPIDFKCHHMILEYPSLHRYKRTQE
jgi:hypothetical protein